MTRHFKRRAFLASALKGGASRAHIGEIELLVGPRCMAAEARSRDPGLDVRTDLSVLSYAIGRAKYSFRASRVSIPPRVPSAVSKLTHRLGSQRGSSTIHTYPRLRRTHSITRFWNESPFAWVDSSG